jgi:hypothetical protein
MNELLALGEVDDDLDETADDIDETPPESSDNVGDPSVEINIETLIIELEADGITKSLHCGQDAKKRLEELMESKRAMRDLEDFDDYNI